MKTSYKNFISVEDYLAATVASIEENGWIAKSNTTGKTPTCIDALERMAVPPTQAQKDIVKEAIAWIHSDNWNVKNEFLYTIYTFARHETIEVKCVGYLAYLIEAYKKYLQNQTENQKQANISKHQGNIGESITRTLTIVSTKEINGTFNSILHTMKDTDGNIFIWFSSGKTFEIGKEYTIKAKVKNHDTYNGIQQTILKLCKEVQ